MVGCCFPSPSALGIVLPFSLCGIFLLLPFSRCGGFVLLPFFQRGGFYFFLGVNDFRCISQCVGFFFFLSAVDSCSLSVWWSFVCFSLGVVYFVFSQFAYFSLQFGNSLFALSLGIVFLSWGFFSLSFGISFCLGSVSPLSPEFFDLFSPLLSVWILLFLSVSDSFVFGCCFLIGFVFVFFVLLKFVFRCFFVVGLFIPVWGACFFSVLLVCCVGGGGHRF